jgi:hypothetical protein
MWQRGFRPTYTSAVAPLGAVSQAWVSVEAALPHGWSFSGVWRFGDEWIALSEGPDRDYLDASGRNAEQALRRLGDRLRVARGSTTG